MQATSYSRIATWSSAYLLSAKHVVIASAMTANDSTQTSMDTVKSLPLCVDAHDYTIIIDKEVGIQASFHRYRNVPSAA
jgi:hypothetical protein